MTLVRQITKQLAELRKKQKLTQEELAELLDVPVQHVSRIESGDQNITVATLERIAVALGVTISVKFEKVGEPRKPPLSRRQKALRSKKR